MPDNSGGSQDKGKICGASTPKTPHPNPPSPTKLAALTSSSGPVKNADEAKAFLEQRALLAVNNNYTAETLANIVFNTALESKLLKIASSIIKAVGFLIIHKLNVNITTEINNLSNIETTLYT